MSDSTQAGREAGKEPGEGLYAGAAPVAGTPGPTAIGIDEISIKAEEDRLWIKGQKYPLLSRKASLPLKGRRALNKLLGANQRLHTAYLLKGAIGQVWEYQPEGWARRVFENWKAALKWQRLKPYEKFAEMIERHGDGMAAYAKAENKVSLGFVEGLNNKIRVIQRRAYG